MGEQAGTLPVGGEPGFVGVARRTLDAAPAHLGPALLPRVLGDSPTAVLVIDRDRGDVVYANTAALELAGAIGLPVSTDAWSTQAGLTDVRGEPLSETAHPLSRVAAGEPVAGEPVRIGATPVHERATASGPVLWMTGFPLGAGEDASERETLSLVVFLPVDRLEDGDGADSSPESLSHRALSATDICFTISDPRQPGNPLVWVNPSFAKVTGYAAHEVLGRNCKFLQGPATNPAAVAQIVTDLSAGRSSAVTLLNYRADGTAFWNHLSISPVHDHTGELVSFVGVQSDVTARLVADAERDGALARERAARLRAEHELALAQTARSRLAVLAEAMAMFADSLDPTELQDRLAQLCVPRLADWITIVQVDETGVVSSMASHHHDGQAARPLLDRFEAEHLGRTLPPGTPTAQAVASGDPVGVTDLAAADAGARSPRLADVLESLGTGSVLAIPLISRHRTWGAMALVRAQVSAFTDHDLTVAADLGRRAGQALDNASTYTREASVAEALQHALLPQLPIIPGVHAAARYTAASAAAVGGDFYDLLPLPGDAVGIVIGDVVGHDITAAAAMGQLRGIVRSEAWAADSPDPHTVLTRVDRLLQLLDMPVLATVGLLRASRPASPDGDWTVECSNAGHPPALLRTPDGAVEVFCDDHDLLLGTGMAASVGGRSTSSRNIPAGSQLLLFTDGLVEQPTSEQADRTRDQDAGLANLRDLWFGQPIGTPPETVCAAVDGLVVQRLDDIAVLAVQLGSAPAGRLPGCTA